jgi:hypothetical protein
MGLKKKDSCSSFKVMKILPFCSQYIYFLMQYVINNSHLFKRNTEVANIGTRQNMNLRAFPPSMSFTEVQKGAYYSGIILTVTTSMECNSWRIYGGLINELMNEWITCS